MSKYSFTTMASPDWDGKTAIKKAREYGYQGVDLRISDHLGELKVTSTDAEIKELRKIFKEEGIISSSVLSYNTQATAEPDSWDKLEDSVLRNLEVGTKLGTGLVRIFIGNPDCTGDHEGFIKRTAEVLIQVLKKDTTSMPIIIQNHTGGLGIHDILKVMKQVKTPRLNMVLCPANAYCMGEKFDDVMEEIKGSLPQLYIADLTTSKDKEETALPGKGVIDFDKIYKQLGAKDFNGWISFKWEKIWRPALPGPEIALPHFIEFVKKLTGEK